MAGGKSSRLFRWLIQHRVVYSIASSCCTGADETDPCWVWGSTLREQLWIWPGPRQLVMDFTSDVSALISVFITLHFRLWFRSRGALWCGDCKWSLQRPRFYGFWTSPIERTQYEISWTEAFDSARRILKQCFLFSSTVSSPITTLLMLKRILRHKIQMYVANLLKENSLQKPAIELFW